MISIQKFSLRTLVALALAASFFLPGFSQDEKAASILYHRGLHFEEVSGDLEKAIEAYREVVLKYPGEREVVAKALLRIGICYEKLGKKEAQTTFQRIIKEFSDQKDVATEARVRLQNLRGPVVPIAGGGMVNRQVWADSQSDPSGSVSFDGRYLAFIDWDSGDLAVRDLFLGHNRRLTRKGSWNTSDFALHARWSPDTREIAYAWFYGPGCDLRVIGLSSSRERIIYKESGLISIKPGGWSPDGRWICACLRYEKEMRHSISLIKVSDGTQRMLKTTDWQYPDLGGFSPDGRFIVYDFPQKGDSSKRDIFLLATGGSGEVPLIEHPAEDFVLGWTPDGGGVLFSSNRTGTYDVWMIRVKDGRPEGDPELLKSDIGRIMPLGITADGAFFYNRVVGTRDNYTAVLDPLTLEVTSEPERLSQRFIGTNKGLDWSPDGKYLAYLSVRHQELREPLSLVCVVRSLETGEERELRPKPPVSYDTGNESSCLRWFPDGSSFLVEGLSQNRRGFYKIDLETGKAASFILAAPGEKLEWPAWSPDGKIFYYLIQRKDRSRSIMARHLETGKKEELYRTETPSIMTNLALSPDGQKIVFRAGILEDYPSLDILKTMPAEGGEPEELMRESVPEDRCINDAPGLVWTPDGSHLFFGRWLDYQEGMLELWKVPASGGKSERIGVAMTQVQDIRIHPDGTQIGFVAGREIDQIWMLENFFPQKK